MYNMLEMTKWTVRKVSALLVIFAMFAGTAFIWHQSSSEGTIFGNILKGSSILISFHGAASENLSTTNDIPFIYVITPTYDRLVQKADLTRLMNTLLLVPNLHWIVIEDSYNKTEKVKNLLHSSGISYTHLAGRNSGKVMKNGIEMKLPKHRGIVQRNKGLQWLRDNRNIVRKPSVFYFADDDNTYSRQLFEEMRYTKKVSVWPVGLVGGVRYESPIVKNDTVTEWRASYATDRPFAIDMAGFAINTDFLFYQQKVEFSAFWPSGYLESRFLEHLHITLKDLEPKADGCTKVLVWHTRTTNPSIGGETRLIKEKEQPLLEV